MVLSGYEYTCKMEREQAELGFQSYSYFPLTQVGVKNLRTEHVHAKSALQRISELYSVVLQICNESKKHAY